jgi:hypothetical protein
MSKDLVVKKNKFLEKIKQGKAVAKPKSGSLTQLKKAAERPGRNRLVFAIDATASREGAWKVATEITSTRFESVPDKIEVSLAYHGGGHIKELSPFSTNAKTFLDKLQQIRCIGGRTAFNDILDRVVHLPGVACCVYIGDCFEEREADALALARQLKLKGIKMFIFHDTSSSEIYDTDHAARVFAKVVDICGGALMDFNDQSPKQAEEFLGAIALYAVGGRKLLEQQKGQLPGAVKLLEKLQ